MLSQYTSPIDRFGMIFAAVLFVVSPIAVAVAYLVSFLRARRFYRTPTGALASAATRGDTAGVDQALSEGADINGLGRGSGIARPLKSALHGAASAGQTHIVKLLLERGADVEGNLKSSPPLIWAVANGHTEIADVLLAQGATLQVQGLLYEAARTRNIELVQKLLGLGIDAEHELAVYLAPDPLSRPRLRQRIKETLDGANGRCGNCKSVGRGVSRDLVVSKLVSEPGPTGGAVISSTTVTRSTLATESFFVCSACVRARSEALLSEKESVLIYGSGSISKGSRVITSGPNAISPIAKFFEDTKPLSSLDDKTARKRAREIAVHELLYGLGEKWLSTVRTSAGYPDKDVIFGRVSVSVVLLYAEDVLGGVYSYPAEITPDYQP